MKIVFCLVKYNGGNKSLGKSVEYRYWISPLKELGHEVFEFEMDDYLQGAGLTGKKDDGALLQYVRNVRPDWVLMNDYSNDTFTESTWKQISAICKTSNWFGDDNHRYDEGYTLPKSKLFTHPVSCDYFSFDKYKRDGVNNVVLSQWGSFSFDDIIEVETDASLYDATFVGTASPYRKYIIKLLLKHGINVKCFGFGWNHGKVSLGEMKNIFKTSKINLNLEKIASCYDIRFVLSSPRRIFSYIRQNINKKPPILKQIKARHFEIGACGGFQVSEAIPMLDMYYSIGKEIVTFGTIDELIYLCKYYLNKPLERGKIASSCHKRTVSTQLMRHRLEQLIWDIFGVCLP